MALTKLLCIFVSVVTAASLTSSCKLPQINVFMQLYSPFSHMSSAVQCLTRNASEDEQRQNKELLIFFRGVSEMKYEDAGVVIHEVLRQIEAFLDNQECSLWSNLGEDGNVKDILQRQRDFLTPCLRTERKQLLQKKIVHYFYTLWELVKKEKYSVCTCEASYIRVNGILRLTVQLLSRAETRKFLRDQK